MRKLRKLAIIALFVCISIMATSNAFAASAPSATISPAYVSPNPPYPGFTGYCYTTGEPTTALRSGPGTSYSIISNVPPGNYFYVISVSNGWAKVTDRPGDPVDGYISATYLCIAP